MFPYFFIQQETLCIVPCSLSETINFGWFVFFQPIPVHISPPTQGARCVLPALSFIPIVGCLSHGKGCGYEPSVSLPRDHIHRRLDRLVQAQSRNRQTAGLNLHVVSISYLLSTACFVLLRNKCESNNPNSVFLQYFIEHLLCVKMSCLISKGFMVHNQRVLDAGYKEY
jgi:hypothetical protein